MPVFVGIDLDSVLVSATSGIALRCVVDHPTTLGIGTQNQLYAFLYEPFQEE